MSITTALKGAGRSAEDGTRRMQGMFDRFPDFHDDSLSVVAENDMVMA